MVLSTLTAISPVDGRYRNKAENLAAYFSEYADMDDDDELLWDEEDLPFC